MTIAGVVAALRERPTKTVKRMAWVTLEHLNVAMDKLFGEKVVELS